MKVGILYPGSKAHPRLGFDYIDGLKVFFKAQQKYDNLTFTYDSIGIGGLEKEAYQKRDWKKQLCRYDCLCR